MRALLRSLRRFRSRKRPAGDVYTERKRWALRFGARATGRPKKETLTEAESREPLDRSATREDTARLLSFQACARLGLIAGQIHHPTRGRELTWKGLQQQPGVYQHDWKFDSGEGGRVKPVKALRILGQRLANQGIRVTAWWAADHAVRILTGANIRRVSQITPQLHVGGQYRRRGWSRLQKRGITAVVNLRLEFDDAEAGLAPERYLYLPTVDDQAPTLEHLRDAVAFIAAELAAGGSVYIHCGSGIGRAPSVAAAYLVSSGLTPEQAWAQIRAHRPFIRPTSVQLQRIRYFSAALSDQ